MIFVEYLFGGFKVCFVLRLLIIRQIEQPVEIAAENGIVRRRRIHLIHTGKFFQSLFFYLGRHFFIENATL